jgi:hypothetical protein
MIQKGEDWIKVSIVDGIATVTEKGISAEAHADVQTQVQRRVKEEMHSWQQILDLLPDYLKDELAKTPIKKINLTNKIEDGDIRDENALNALQDLLGEKVPKAAFGAYHDALERAFALLGMQGSRINELFDQFGTLQGQELHDAVQRWVAAVVRANDIRQKMSVPFNEGMLANAQANINATTVTHLRDINAQIALTVASMTKLTDLDDIVAAQEKLNDLSQQYYDAAQAATQQLLEEQNQLHQGNRSVYEQVELAGMNDSQKLQYYYKQLADLRENLLHATDDKQIASIEQRMESYVQAILGLAPDDAKNRNNLKLILDDIEKIRDKDFVGVQHDVAEENMTAAKMLQEAAKALLGATEGLKGHHTTPPEKPGERPGMPGDPNDPSDPNGSTGKALADLGITIKDFDETVHAVNDEWRRMLLGGADGKPLGYGGGGHGAVVFGENDELLNSMLNRRDELSKAVAGAVASELRNMELSGAIQVELVVDADGLVNVASRQATQNVIVTLQRNPDIVKSRTSVKR